MGKVSGPPAEKDPPNWPPRALLPRPPGPPGALEEEAPRAFFCATAESLGQGPPWLEADGSCLMRSHLSGAPAWGQTEGGLGRKGWTPGRVQPQGQAPAPHHPRSVSGVSGCPPPAGRGSLQRASSAPGSLRPGSRPRPVLRPLTAAGHAVLLTSCQCLAPCPGHPAAAPDRPLPQALPWPRPVSHLGPGH